MTPTEDETTWDDLGVVEVLAIRDLERQVEPVLLCTALGCLDERGREVQRRHDCARLRRVEGDVPGSARNVEPVLSVLGREALDEGEMHVADELRHVLERSRAPDRGVAAGKFLEGHRSPSASWRVS